MSKANVIRSTLLLMATLLLVAGCISKRNFANDPVKWSFVSGDGSWDANSRRWIVYLPTEETRSAVIRLDNTTSERIEVNVLPQGPSDTVSTGGGGRYPVAAGSNIQITITAVVHAPWGPGTYTIEYGDSFNIK